MGKSAYLYIAVVMLWSMPWPVRGQERLMISLSGRDSLTTIDSSIKAGRQMISSAPDSASRELHRALAMSLRMGDNSRAAQSLFAMGNLSVAAGDHHAALQHYRDALTKALSSSPRNMRFIYMIQNNIALSYTYLGFYEQAARYFYTGVNATDIPLIRSAMYLNLAITQRALGDYEKALTYADKARRIAVADSASAHVIPYIAVNRSEILLHMHKPDQALNAALQGLELTTDSTAEELLHEFNEILGRAYMMKGIPEKALMFYHRGLEIAAAYPPCRLRSLLSIGNLYLKSGNYDSARHYLLEAKASSAGSQLREEGIHTHASLARLYEATGEYKRSLEHVRQAAAMKDSSVNLRKMQFVHLMDVQYQTVQKNREIADKKLLIAEQEARIMRKNILVTGLSVTVLLVAVFSWMFYRHSRKVQRQREEITAWRAMSEGEEKERIRIARDLHDNIGGALSSVKMYFAMIRKRNPGLAGEEHYREAMNMLEHTLDDIRNTAHNLMPELLLRHGLSEAVRIFCRNTGDASGLNIDYQYYGFIGRFSERKELAVYRIVQELVHNVRKHAGAKNVLVQLSQHDHILSVTVEDNGIGMTGESHRHAGLGLQSVERRIADMNGSLQITSDRGRGTTVYFEINLQNVADED